MTPIEHAKLHARDFGGVPGDYLKVDEFFDQTKGALADDPRHRMFLHNPTGIMIAEQVFGPVITNCEGAEIPTREIARRHITQDCGCVPTLREWVEVLAKPHALNRPNRDDLRWLREHRIPEGAHAGS